jgi:hypothetical protein
MPTTNAAEALARLHGACTYLGGALIRAMEAAVELTDARRARAEQLAELIAAAITYCERLLTVVEGDMRADLA